MDNFSTFRDVCRVALLTMTPKKEMLICLLFSLLSGIAFGQKTWNGGTSVDWHTGTNWTPSGVPTSSSNVVIPSSPTNQPTISSSAVARTVEVQSGATLTIASTGTLTTSNFKFIGIISASIHN